MKRYTIIAILLVLWGIKSMGQSNGANHSYNFNISKAHNVVVGDRTFNGNYYRQSVSHQHYNFFTDILQLNEQLKQKKETLEALPDSKKELKVRLKREVDSLEKMLRYYVDKNYELYLQLKTLTANSKRLKKVDAFISKGRDDSAQILLEHDKDAIAREYQDLVLARQQKEVELKEIDQRLQNNAYEYLLLSRFADNQGADSLAISYGKKSLASFCSEDNLRSMAKLCKYDFKETALEYYYLLLSLYTRNDPKVFPIIKRLIDVPDTASKQERLLGRPVALYHQQSDKGMNSPDYIHAQGEALNMAGKIYYIRGNKDSALYCYGEAIKFFKKILPYKGKMYDGDLAEGLNLAGNICLEKKNWKETAEFLEKAAGMYLDLAFDSTAEHPASLYVPLAADLSVDAARAQAEDGQWGNAWGNYNWALGIYRIGRGMSDSLNFLPKIANALYNLAYITAENSDKPSRDSVFMELQEALVIYQQLERLNPGKYAYEIAVTLNNTGQIFQQKEDHDSALLFYRRAYTQLGAPAHRAVHLSTTSYILQNITNVLNEVETKDSIHLLNELVDCYKELEKQSPDVNTEELGIALNNYGAVLAARNDKAKAIEAFKQAEDVYNRLITVRKKEENLNNLATIRQNISRLEASGTGEAQGLPDAKWIWRSFVFSML